MPDKKHNHINSYIVSYILDFDMALLVMHVIILAAFSFFKIRMMVYFNYGSVLFYFGLYNLEKQKELPLAVFLSLVTTEIMLHVIFALL